MPNNGFEEFMRILIIEDEKRIASFIDKGLRAEGYVTTIAYDGEAGLRLACDQEFDLLLIDILLPKLDGVEVLKKVRDCRPAVPVIMLTAKDELALKVSSFDHGASDYITKPFAFEELTARIRAHLRRGDQVNANIMRAGELSLDLTKREVEYRGNMVALTSREFALLEYLVRHQNQIVNRMQILNHVWGYDFDPESNIVDVYIRYLRQKIGLSKDKPLIETVRGAGYRVVTD